MAQITSREELEEWLKDKPVNWGLVIAARAALRVLPYGLMSPWNISRVAKVLFRAVWTSWGVCDSPTDLNRRAAVRAAMITVIYDASGSASARASIARAVYCASILVDHQHPTISSDIAAIAAGVVAQSQNISNDETWQNVYADCEFLEYQENPVLGPRLLTRATLWQSHRIYDWASVWEEARNQLLGDDASFQVWIDWYNRRIKGERAAFDIPGDYDRTEDKKILARLADATNEDFWDKGATYVNTTLQSWIDEARERVRPRDAPFVTDPLRQLEPEPEPIPPQNQNAIPFTASEGGKIRIDERRNVDALRTDGDAQDRHAEAIREARALLDRCRLSNSAARFVSGFENYLAAGGETLADLRPSLFVQRGEKLRQEIAAYESSAQDSFLEPIADDLLIDLKGWRSAHNMAVGLDPVLMRIDTAMLGPDIKPTLIAPSELHAFVADADEADILDEGVREIVDEAIDLAPAIADVNDRRTVWSVESVQNLVIEAFSVALNHPVKTVVGVSAVAVGASLGIDVGLGELVGAAGFLLAKRKWIETKLNNTPTWKLLFIQLCDKAEKALQSIRKSGDDGI